MDNGLIGPYHHDAFDRRGDPEGQRERLVGHRALRRKGQASEASKRQASHQWQIPGGATARQDGEARWRHPAKSRGLFWHEKPLGSVMVPVPQTDTGRRGVYLLR